MIMNGRKLVYYLSKVAPQVVADLNQNHLSAPQALSTDIILGDVGTGVFDHKQRSLYLDLITRGITKLRSDLASAMGNVKARMVASQRARLWGGIVAASSGAISAFAAFWGRESGSASETVILVGAIVSSLGGLSTIFADHLERAPSGIRISGAEWLSSLSEVRLEVEGISLRFERSEVAPVSDADIAHALNVLDGASLRLIKFNIEAS